MAKSYNLTMQLNLRGPSNLQRVSSNIRKQLSGAAALNLNIDKRSLSSIDSATAKIKSLTQALNAGQKAADNMNASLSSMGKSLGSIKGAGSAASSSFRQIDKDLSTIGSNMNRATAASESFGASLFKKAKGVAAVRVLSSLTSELSNRFLQAASAAVEFERSLVKIRQITGSGAQSIAELGNTIRSLSKEFGVSANEMANVAVTLQQAGLSADQLNASLRTLAQASLSATFTNMTEATEGLIAALKQFKLQTKDIQPAIDAMNSVAGKFAVEFGDLVSAVQRGGGAFAAAAGGIRSASGEMREGSQSLNEYLGLFTSVRQTTRESAESISTALRTIGARLQQLSTQTSLEDIIGTKLELTKDGQFVGVYEAIGKISKALQEAGISAGDVRFAQVAEQIGGIRQISKTIPLLTEYKIAQDAVAVANQANNQSAKEAALAQQTLANQLSRTYEAWSDTAAAFLNNTGLKTLVGLMLSLTRGAASFVKAFAPLAPIFAILGGAKLLKKFTAPKIPKPKGLGGLFGRNVSTAAGSPGEQQKASVEMVAASTRNTTALERLTEAISRLISSGSGRLGFARGGIVPGTGRGDTVPAMLTPGEFVIRKDAVSAIGAGNLHKMNKYATGGLVSDIASTSGVSQRFRKSVVTTKEEPFRTGAAVNSDDRLEAEIRYHDYQLSSIKAGLKGSKSKKYNDYHYDDKYQGTEGLLKALESNDNNVKGDAFETYLEGKLGQVRTGHKAAVDFTSGPGHYREAKNVQDKLSENIFLDKLYRARVDDGSYSGLTQTPTSQGGQKINMGTIHVDYLKKALGGPILATDTVGAAIMEDIESYSPTVTAQDIAAATAKGRQDEQKVYDQLIGILGSRSYTIRKSGLGTEVNKLLKEKMGSGSVDMVNSILSSMGVNTVEGDENQENLLSTMNAGMRGAVFETILTAMKQGGVYATASKSNNDYFDYTSGLGAAAKLFEGLDGLDFIDAKLSLGAASNANMARKIGNEILRSSSGLSAEQIADLVPEGDALTNLKNAILANLGSATNFNRGKKIPLPGTALAEQGRFTDMVAAVTNAYASQGLSTEAGNDLLGKIFKITDSKNFGGKGFSINDLVQRLAIGGRVSDEFLKKYKGKGIDWSDSWGTYIVSKQGPSITPSIKRLSEFNGDEALIEEFIRRGNLALTGYQSSPRRGYGPGSLRLRTRRRYAQGGSAEDTVPAMLTPGEFVINKKAAARIGSAKLEKLNKADKISGFNKGGPVGFIQRFAAGGSAQSINSQIAVSTAEVKNLATAQSVAEKEYLALAARLKSMDDSLVAGIEGNKAYKRAVDIKIELEKKLLAAEEAAIKVMEDYQSAEQQRTQLIKQAKALKASKNDGKVSAGSGGGFNAIDNLVKTIATKKENVKAAFADAAANRGVSKEQFTSDVRKKSREQYLINRGAIRDTRTDLKSTLISASARGLGKERDRENFKAQVAGQLESILGDMDPAKLEKVIANAMKEIDLGGSFQDIIDKVPEVADAFDEAKDSIRALAGVEREVTSEFGGIVEEAKIDANDLADLEFRDKGGNKKFGGLGGVLDTLKDNGVTNFGSFELSKTKIGKKFSDLNTQLANPTKAIGDFANKIPGIGPKLGGLVKSFGGLKAALGGLPGITSAAAYALADRLIPAMDQIETAGGAALAGGTRGALSGAASGASIGFMLGGPIGAAIGTAVGAIGGAITGALEAFRAKRLELALGKLNASIGKLDQAFSNYELTKSSESLQLLKNASKTAGSDLNTVKGLAQFGNKRTVANWWAETLTLGIFNLRPGENEDKALEAFVNTGTKILDDIGRMAQINAESMSIESLRRGQDQIRTGNQNAGIYSDAAARDFGINQRDLADLAASKKIIDQYGVELGRQIIGNLRSTRGESGDNKLVELGNEELLQRRLTAQEMAIQAQLNKQISVELENILNKYTQLNAAITRIRSDFDRNRNERQARTDYLGGNRKVSFLGSSKDSDILKNPRAYNLEEFNAAADRTANLVGGGEIGKEVSDALKAQRTIAIDLPRILTQATYNNTQAVAERFQSTLEQGGLDPSSAKGIADQIESVLARQLGSGGEGSVSLQTLANEIGPLQSALQGMQEQIKFAEEVQSLWTDAVNESIQIVNEWGDALENARERGLKATKAGIEGDLAIKNARGQRTSLDEKNASFLAEFDSLVRGNLRARGRNGNDLNLAEIAKERASTANAIKSLRNELNTPGVKDAEAKTQRLGELQLKDERLRKALEHVADSTEMMDNALRQYSERVAKEDKSVDFLNTLATGGPDELAEINRSIYALNVALGDNVAEQNRLFATAEGRAAALKGAEYVAQAEGLSEEEQARLLAQAQLRVFERTPGMGELLDNTIGTNEDGTARTVRQVLEERADPNFVPPEIKAAQEAQAKQIEANKRLEEWQASRATELKDLVADPIVKAISQLPRLLADAMAALREKDILPTNPVAPPPGENSPPGQETPRETLAAEDRVFSGQTRRDGKDEPGQNELQDLRLAYGKRTRDFRLRVGLDDFQQTEKVARIKGVRDAALKAQQEGVSLEEFQKNAGLQDSELLGAKNMEQLIQQYNKLVDQIIADIQKEEKNNPTLEITKAFEEMSKAWAMRLQSENGLNALPPTVSVPPAGAQPNVPSEIAEELETLKQRIKHINDIETATDLTPALAQERAAAEARIKELESQIASGGSGSVGSGGVPLVGGIDPSWVKDIADKVYLIEGHTKASKESLGLVTFAVQEIAKAIPSFDKLRSSIDALAATSIPLVLTSDSTSILRQSNSIMENFNKDFGSYVTRLEQVAVKLPSAIEIKGRYTVDVNHNGSEVFASMKEDLSSLITCRVQRALYEASPDTVRPPTGECG